MLDILMVPLLNLIEPIWSSPTNLLPELSEPPFLSFEDDFALAEKLDLQQASVACMCGRLIHLSRSVYSPS
jgi:hypothetical protein